MTTRVPIFDGHNDVLLRLYRHAQTKGPQAFLDGEAKGHLDLPKALEGGFAGGLFAVFVPSTGKAGSSTGDSSPPSAGSDAPTAPPVELGATQSVVFSMFSLLLRIERESQGRVRVCRSVSDIRRCIRDGVLAPVLHIEGAEAIDQNFEILDVLYAAGLRSLGPVWSRPNVFGHGVPFLCPSSPDTGPGLTDLGKELIRQCNRLRILIDLSHLNERGFWDVAAISNAPLVATHSNAHALSPHSRNLTDKQLAAIQETGGMVGVNFATSFLRPDGARDADTSIDLVTEHLQYLLEHVGEDGVGFGSDFDGARMPSGIGTAAGLPNLVAAMRARGFGKRLIASDHQLTVLKIGVSERPTITQAWCGKVSGAGSPIVTTSDGGSDPIVWMVGAEGDNRLHGFKGDTGEPLLPGGAGPAMVGLHHFQTLIASRDRLYVGADGRIYAFAF